MRGAGACNNLGCPLLLKRTNLNVFCVIEKKTHPELPRMGISCFFFRRLGIEAFQVSGNTGAPCEVRKTANSKSRPRSVRYVVGLTRPPKNGSKGFLQFPQTTPKRASTPKPKAHPVKVGRDAWGKYRLCWSFILREHPPYKRAKGQNPPDWSQLHDS